MKTGQDLQFQDAHKRVGEWSGLTLANILKFGENTYFIIAEWPDLDTMANTRPAMTAALDTFRHPPDLGSGLGLTDAISRPMVMKSK